ncbi:SEC-C metal-binding domain-containing protein [Actinomadura sp. SCN-SB]|uniref:SEC-C metal-binding domain-containing protein n=1 Tax=Actinomadura sp. SCN-SB TaxID=3373092 RepID=UPI0037509707
MSKSAPSGKVSTEKEAKGAEEAKDETPQIKAKGLDKPKRAKKLDYSAPTVDGEGGVEHHSEDAKDEYAGVSRNDPCPCGSGKKFKRCHGDPRNR